MNYAKQQLHMGKEDFIDFFEEKKEKSIKDYCKDIINACYYDLSKLIELKVIKLGKVRVDVVFNINHKSKRNHRSRNNADNQNG